MELKPCPFCGVRPELRQHPICDIIECENPHCPVSLSILQEHPRGDHQKAHMLVAAWNTRAVRTCHNDNRETWNEDFICSECGVIFCQEDGEYYGPHLYMPFSSEGVAPSFCPNCGAKVVEQ